RLSSRGRCFSLYNGNAPAGLPRRFGVFGPPGRFGRPPSRLVAPSPPFAAAKGPPVSSAGSCRPVVRRSVAPARGQGRPPVLAAAGHHTGNGTPVPHRLGPWRMDRPGRCLRPPLRHGGPGGGGIGAAPAARGWFLRPFS